MSENTTAKTYIFREVPIEEASAFGEKNGIFQQTEQWAAFRSFYKTSAIMGFCQEKPVLSLLNQSLTANNYSRRGVAL